ncbi:MAG: porin [Planctomycetaceae bacterium]|jgi:hypothetical protein|nr:porin [Planctomycetaceae bacterium]
MWFKNTLTLIAAAVMAIGGTAIAQAPTGQPTITQVSNVLTADENCGKDAAKKKAGCDDPSDHAWLHPALADAKNKVAVGFGIRTTFQAFEDGAESNGGRTRDFNLDNVRIFLSGKISEKISANFHTDINGAQPGHGTDNDGLHVLDAVINYELTDTIGVKFGRFLPPTDRSNLSGPFFINAWEFPWVQYTNGYYDIFQGRDDGVVLHGEMGDDTQIKWSFGIFEGYDTTGVAGDDNVWVVGRVVANFLDKEEGYFNSSTYYGEKDIAAIGMSFSNQADAHGDGIDYTSWSLDALYEKKTDGGGVLTAEAAYYDRDHDGDAGFQDLEGEGYFMLVSYLFSNSTSLGNLEGRLQPSIRYQESDRQAPGVGNRENQVDYALNYIIHGHSARLSLVFSDIGYSGGVEDEQRVTIGGQIRF